MTLFIIIDYYNSISYNIVNLSGNNCILLRSPGKNTINIYVYKSRGNIMFFTMGLVLGFVIGWYVNEKVENLADKANPLNWFKKKQ